MGRFSQENRAANAYGGAGDHDATTCCDADSWIDYCDAQQASREEEKRCAVCTKPAVNINVEVSGIDLCRECLAEYETWQSKQLPVKANVRTFVLERKPK